MCTCIDRCGRASSAHFSGSRLLDQAEVWRHPGACVSADRAEPTRVDRRDQLRTTWPESGGHRHVLRTVPNATSQSPHRPNLEHLRSEAREFHRRLREGEQYALALAREFHPRFVEPAEQPSERSPTDRRPQLWLSELANPHDQCRGDLCPHAKAGPSPGPATPLKRSCAWHVISCGRCSARPRGTAVWSRGRAMAGDA